MAVAIRLPEERLFMIGSLDEVQAEDSRRVRNQP